MNKDNYGSTIKDTNYNMLDIIFNARAEELSDIISNDTKIIGKTKEKTSKGYATFKNNLDKIPNEYKEIKRKVVDGFNEYSKALEYRENYFNEVYYKAGMKDAFNIIMNCIDIRKNNPQI